MNSRVGRLGGHSHDSRNLTFLFRSREATTHRVYLNEVDTPLVRIYTLRGFESVLPSSQSVLPHSPTDPRQEPQGGTDAVALDLC